MVLPVHPALCFLRRAKGPMEGVWDFLLPDFMAGQKIQ